MLTKVGKLQIQMPDEFNNLINIMNLMIHWAKKKVLLR